MKKNVHSWKYLAQFLLDWEIFDTKFVDKILKNLIIKNFFFQKSFRLWDNVEKYGKAREAIDINKAQRMCIAG